VGEDVSGLHTPRFAFDEEVLPVGSALLAALALEASQRAD
jgi:hippurate hydrolase